MSVNPLTQMYQSGKLQWKWKAFTQKYLAEIIFPVGEKGHDQENQQICETFSNLLPHFSIDKIDRQR